MTRIPDEGLCSVCEETGGWRPVTEPARCPCGHPVGESYRCIAGRIYGPCGDENCGGVCVWTDDCTEPDCICSDDN